MVEEDNNNEEVENEKIEDVEVNDNKNNKVIKISLKKLIIFILILIIIVTLLGIVFTNEKIRINLFHRDIYKDIDTSNTINKNELANKIGITVEELDYIESTYLIDEEENNEQDDVNQDTNEDLENGRSYWLTRINYRSGECTDSQKKERLNKLEEYIYKSDDKYTKELYENINKRLNNDLYSKWYSSIFSGIIKYHLGGEITDINLNIILNPSKISNVEVNEGYICIDNFYYIKVSTLGNPGGLIFHMGSKTNNLKKIELTTIRQPAMDNTDAAKPIMDKPIIYIYPEKETNINVKLGNPEYLTCTYPKYKNDGWNVIAKPNGDLEDIETGRNLYALYWEGISKKEYDYENIEEGFLVKGEDTAKFLEEKLEILGLNEREAEEFIVYWLPQMEKNKYNYIRFETMEEIEKEMPLEIEPKPDTVIRVLMDWKPLDEKIKVKEQELEKIERKGYTVVEWGGSVLNENIVK